MITHNLLTELLSSADVKDSEKTAERLFARYHTLDGILSADSEALINYVGEEVAVLIKLVGALVARRASDKFALGVCHSPEDITELLLSLFVGRSVETLVLISIDENGITTSHDVMSEGTVNATSILPRQILERAVKNRAKRVIIAHNHPGGTDTPSEDDLIFTSTVSTILECAEIELMAHYVVAGARITKI